MTDPTPVLPRLTLPEFCALRRGTQAALSAYLKVKPCVVSSWCAGRRRVPPRHAKKIETFTNGLVPRQAACPHFDW